GGGIAWVTFYDPADGNLPLGADRFGLLDGLLEEPLEEISNVAQVVWDRKVWLEEGRRELLFTQHVDVPGYSTVVRVYRASPPGTLAWSHEEFGYGLLEYAFGLAILPPELDCEAQGLGDPGHLLIAEDRPQAALPGRLKRYGDDLCGEGTLQYLLDAYRNPTQGFDHLQGIAVHAPQGGSALPLGIYVAERGAGRILRFSGPPIAWYEMSVFQQAAASQPAHVLVHEPYLFVSEDRPDGKIRRLKATGSYTNLPFVEGAQNPHGMTVLPSGVLVFSEGDVVKGRLVAVDGWKYRFNRGDANGDGAINISDAVFVQAYLFLGGPAPGCFDAADVNDDSRVSLSDSVYLLNYLFQGGDPPPAPFYGEHPSPGQCGWDPTIDLLGCLSFGVSGCAIRP
ncbi:MAG: dockerin type I domain-containing protein, partial [Planctomycetota bacterium]